MEDSNYDSHILDVEREKLDSLALGKPMDLVNKLLLCINLNGTHIKKESISNNLG